jgi:hypothetical protein
MFVVEQCIIDSFLCFISSTINSYTKEQIIQLSIRFYSEDDVKMSKKIVCEILKTDPKWRRTGDKKRLEMLDVVQLVETVLQEKPAPKFVADSHYAFPSLSGIEHIANDVLDIKSELADLKVKFEEDKKNCQNSSPSCSEDMTILKEELIEIKKYLSEVAKKPAESLSLPNNATKKSELNKNLPNMNNNARSKSPLKPTSPKRAQKELVLNTDATVQTVSVPNNDITVEQFSDILKKHSKSDTNVVNGQIKKPQAFVGNKVSNSSTHHPSDDNKPPRGKYTEDSEGFLTKNKRGSFKRKTGAIKIQAVQRDIEVYIGRLVEKTKLEDLVQHIEEMVGIKVLRCRKLNCQNRLCSSFKVIISEKDANKFFMSRDTIWPVGTDVREFVQLNYY